MSQQGPHRPSDQGLRPCPRPDCEGGQKYIPQAEGIWVKSAKQISGAFVSFTLTGRTFLRVGGEVRGLQEVTRAQEVLLHLQLSPRGALGI